MNQCTLPYFIDDEMISMQMTLEIHVRWKLIGIWWLLIVINVSKPNCGVVDYNGNNSLG